MLFLKDNNSTEQKNIGYLIKICIEIITLLLITFWSGSAAGLEFDQDGEDDSYQSDPRKDEDWKIQRRKGFLKDRESKAQQAKQVKLSYHGSITTLIHSKFILRNYYCQHDL